MEIINNKHSQAQKIVSKPYISFSHDMKRFFINAAGTITFNLNPGIRGHFMLDIDRLYIFFNDDPAGVCGQNNQRGLTFNAANVLAILERRNPLIRGLTKFTIRKSNTTIQESLTLEVMVHKKLKPKKKVA